MSDDVTTAAAHVAELLATARATRRPVPPVRGMLPAGDVGAAYRVQSINIRHQLGKGRQIVGRKIGLTSAAVQTQLGVDQPDFGVLLDDMAHYGDTVTVPTHGLIAPRIEAEIAFVLTADIVEIGLDRFTLMQRIASVAAAAEIVDSAIAGWEIGIVDTIADNASSGRFAIGSRQAYVPGRDLVRCAMRLYRDGVVATQGTGAASLGDPLNALAWLADTAAVLGSPLRAGEIILAGALGSMIVFEPGEYRIEIDGFAPLTVVAS